MELLQYTISRADDLDSRFRQPGEPGRLTPTRPALLSSSSSDSGEQLPPSLSALLRSSSSSESGEQLPPSLSTLLWSSSRSESGDPGRSSFEHRCLVNLAKAYLASAPARKTTPYTKYGNALRANPKVILEQSKKFAEGALEYYNKRKKIKFELMDVMPVNSMSESCNFYTHVNFAARSRKEGSQEQLFFAELQLCSKRQSSSGFIVTCCEPLGPDSTVGHKGFQPDGASTVRKNVDFTYCFACSPRMFHPKGGKYIAGHCYTPCIYDSPY